MKLIVGLGNPGSKYRNTYHNLGFMCVDELAKKLKLKFDFDECASLVAKGVYEDGKIKAAGKKPMYGDGFVIAKPQTFMNLSGTAVKQLIAKYDVADDELFVCYDDADLPVGHVRVRYEGSAGTHNGMRNIIAENNITDFNRMRFGFQTPQLKSKQVELIDYVLRPVEFDDKTYLSKCIAIGTDALCDWLKGETIERVMARVNAFDGTK